MNKEKVFLYKSKADQHYLLIYKSLMLLITPIGLKFSDDINIKILYCDKYKFEAINKFYKKFETYEALFNDEIIKIINSLKKELTKAINENYVYGYKIIIKNSEILSNRRKQLIEKLIIALNDGEFA